MSEIEKVGRLQDELTAALRDGASTEGLAEVRFLMSEVPVHEVHNALSASVEKLFAEKAQS